MTTQPQAIAVVIPPPKAPRRLATLGHVRRELARVYADAREGRIASSDGSRFAYMLNLLAGVIEAEHIETRLAALESRTQEPQR